MDRTEVYDKVVSILTPYVKKPDALARLSANAHIFDDLEVNSARLVDVALALEDEFGIEIADEDFDSVNTVGDAVTLITAKLG